ncbi:MAG: DUF6151 family protein [Sphingopyxis sp.]|uniref:DUF6151 family protein n=1 Tax=Sphingopyxis sp. TaxID=1908224 RepID=UPI002ABA5AE7|nr:DUF6151 family protein [Sphingopyxis sp.]MDZ3833620.1 DUF6151 family protein [Sphingopyxis sp.]
MTTGSDLRFSCSCGEVEGRLLNAGPREGDHIVCHCSDCQGFARYLGAAERVLDGSGGTALFQSRCARMRLSKGRDRLASLHLTDKPTLRWYATCCRTPMFNTYANGRIPYVTTLVANCNAERRDDVLGPVIGHLFTEDAGRDVGDVPRMSMAKLMRRFFRRMVRDMISGDRRRSALFDAATLEPIAAPHRLTPDERQALAGD